MQPERKNAGSSTSIADDADYLDRALVAINLSATTALLYTAPKEEGWQQTAGSVPHRGRLMRRDVMWDLRLCLPSRHKRL